MGGLVNFMLDFKTIRSFEVTDRVTWQDGEEEAYQAQFDHDQHVHRHFNIAAGTCWCTRRIRHNSTTTNMFIGTSTSQQELAGAPGVSGTIRPRPTCSSALQHRSR